MFDIKGIMQKAQNMQNNVKKAQEELKNMTFTGDISNGSVQIIVNGSKEVVSVKISEEAKKEETQILEDLILATFNDALKKCSEISKQKMNEATGGLGAGLPDGLI